MKKIISALGLLVIISLISGCIGFLPKRPTVKYVEKPPLTISVANPLKLENIDWVVITKNNYEKILSEATDANGLIFLAALSEKDYKKLATNNAKVLSYIRHQNAILNAYKIYYENNNK